jgi:hypothetical protein
LAAQPQEAPPVKIIAVTTIDLCASVFPWAKFRTHKEAIKLHTVLTGLLSQCVLVTDGKTHDRRAIRDLHFGPDDLLIFDRACLDYAWLYRLHQGRVWFVPRLKTNSCYEVIQTQGASGPVLADQIIRLSSLQGQACPPGGSGTLSPPLADRALFQVDQTKPEDQGFLRRLQECRADLNLDRLDRLSASGLAQIQDQGGLGTAELTRLAQTMLLERCNLWAMLCPPPPDNRQPLLFN